MDQLHAAQIRGARAMLGWSMADLSQAAKVSVAKIRRIEAGDPQPVSDDVRRAVRGALEVAGARFLDCDGSGLGVRVREA